MVAASVAVAVASGLGERRRKMRRDLDRVGWVDWRVLQFLALFVLLVCGALWLKV